MEGPSLAVVVSEIPGVGTPKQQQEQQEKEPQQEQQQEQQREHQEEQQGQEDDAGRDGGGRTRNSKAIFSLKKPTLLPKSLHYRPQTQVSLSAGFKYTFRYTYGGNT